MLSIGEAIVTMGIAHFADSDLRAAAAGTDRFVEANPDSQNTIESTRRVFRHLLDLPPATSENFFSGNLAPILEADREITASVTLARMGLYKQALTSLRSALELGLLAVYWDAEDQSHIDIQNWWRGREATPQNRAVDARLSRISGVAAYIAIDDQFFVRVRSLGWKLGGYVHTRGGRNSASGLVPSTNLPTFAEDAFILWCGYLVEVGRAVLSVHLMKYPVGLQITPLSQKFGLNPPAGGFLEPYIREFFRDYLTEEMRNTLQSLSDSDPDAPARAAWANDRPDISDELLREQVERHDREWIEMGGFESWEQLQELVARNVNDSVTHEEREERREYRTRLREWAESEGYLTLESSIETRMRSIQALRDADAHEGP